MNSYLDLAEDVILFEKRPLSSKEIIGLAFSLDIMPKHLFGKTLHKTLQARLSEDILKNKQESKFLRVARGKFYLRSLNAEQFEEAYEEIVARRRILDLRYKQVLSFILLDDFCDGLIDQEVIEKSIANSAVYANIKDVSHNFTIMWAAAVLRKNNMVLSYRRGSFREDRDDFLNQRSVALFSPVVRRDADLFNSHLGGLLNSINELVCLDLDLSPSSHWRDESSIDLVGIQLQRSRNGASTALGLVEISVPDWFDVPRQRLSINDVRWIDPGTINDMDGYDPWSRSIIKILASRRQFNIMTS